VKEDSTVDLDRPAVDRALCSKRGDTKNVDKATSTSHLHSYVRKRKDEQSRAHLQGRPESANEGD
jgi:hypothetical protein